MANGSIPKRWADDRLEDLETGLKARKDAGKVDDLVVDALCLLLTGMDELIQTHRQNGRFSLKNVYYGVMLLVFGLGTVGAVAAGIAYGVGKLKGF